MSSEAIAGLLGWLLGLQTAGVAWLGWKVYGEWRAYREMRRHL